MNTFGEFCSKFFFTLFWVVILFFLIKYNWKRRWLYYYASKLQGPSSWPVIGSSLHFIQKEGFHAGLAKMTAKYPPVFRVWMGLDLMIVNSNPEEVDILLNKFLEKAPLYHAMDFMLKESILTGPVPTWKTHRRLISHTFNPKILNSFMDIFNKYSIELNENLKTYCQENQFEVFTTFWECTIKIACETLLDVDPSVIKGQSTFISRVAKIEENGSKWFCAAAIFPEYLWKYAKIFQYLDYMSSRVMEHIQNVIDLKINENFTWQKKDDDELKSKRFLNYLLDSRQKSDAFTNDEILQEVQTMWIASSETTAITLCFVMIVLATHKDVQEKIYQELCTIFEDFERDVTLEDLSKMDYTERVIKETMRVLSPAPVIARYVDEDIKLGSVFYPKGCSVAIPIGHLHKKPDLWENPERFDPDRFLPHRSKNRHRCAYIPFGYGPRNCVGFVYGMMSMKVIMATLLRKYEVVSVNYKSLEDVQLNFSIIAKPQNGCRMVLKKR